MSNPSKSHKKKNRKYVPGRKTIKFGPFDAGMIFKGMTGQVKFFAPAKNEDSQPMGGPSFWVNFLRWLFEAGPDGDERRDTFVQEFVADMEDRQIRREAERRVAAAAGEDEALTAETREALVLEAIDQIREEANAVAADVQATQAEAADSPGEGEGRWEDDLAAAPTELDSPQVWVPEVV